MLWKSIAILRKIHVSLGLVENKPRGDPDLQLLSELLQFACWIQILSHSTALTDRSGRKEVWGSSIHLDFQRKTEQRSRVKLEARGDSWSQL